MPTVTKDKRTSSPASPKKGFDRTLGSLPLGDGRCLFRVWAPRQERLALHVVSPVEQNVEMTRDDLGYFEVEAALEPGARYFYRLPDGTDRPDPCSRLQPGSVHGPSEVVATDFAWSDQQWRGIPLQRLVIYELHVGLFTPGGTFESAIPELGRLRDLGITAIELMPVSQFPGRRNWGYDGVYPSAVQNSYGGPEGLKRLVDAMHAHGMAAVLDVVYNHLGPEGNYLADFGPYFTDRYRTPWGSALNFDGPDSDEVRRYFLDSALGWISEFHFDALRVDAVHAIVDHSAFPFLAELTRAVHDLGESLGRSVYLIAESDLNDPRVLRPEERGGYGMDAQWNDDFHHALHALLTGERSGYFADFGSIEDLAVVYRRGFRYAGDYSSFRRRRYGAPPDGIEGTRFVVCSQNHDQIGNRMLGDRLAASLTEAQLRLSAAAVILSPFLPMLFMGEEYGETAPFQYFTDHSDVSLIEAVRKGRCDEFAAFGWKGEVPDVAAESTFECSRLDVPAQRSERGRSMTAFYKLLLELRSRETSFDLPDLSLNQVEILGARTLVLTRRGTEGQRSVLILNFGKASMVAIPFPRGAWRPAFRSSESGVIAGGASAETEGLLKMELGANEAAFWIEAR